MSYLNPPMRPPPERERSGFICRRMSPGKRTEASQTLHQMADQLRRAHSKLTACSNDGATISRAGVPLRKLRGINQLQQLKLKKSSEAPMLAGLSE